MVAEQINQIVDMVAEKLGVAVEAVYPMLIKQAEVFGSTYKATLWITGVAFVLTMLFLVLLIWNCDSYNGDFVVVVSTIGFFVFGLVFIIGGIVALMDLNTYFTALHNPEWWAIEYVTKLVK